jgi:subtilisin family serine protease
VNGTSFAAPIVAGICALILSKNPNYNPTEIRTILQLTANSKDG